MCHRAINALAKMAGLYEVSNLAGQHISEPRKGKHTEKILRSSSGGTQFFFCFFFKQLGESAKSGNDQSG